ncbi:MAG: hydroxymethylglutaryl-CoA reductase, degradative [Pseudomonadales bacterium]
MGSSTNHRSSRIPNFFQLSIQERITALVRNGFLTAEDEALLAAGNGTLRTRTADKMIENVVGVFGLPVGVALNFLINDRDYVIPLVVEEPSIVAGLSGAARMARAGGGFRCNSPEPILMGQVQVVGVNNVPAAIAALQGARDRILHAANALHPNMVARGGGARDIHVEHHIAPESGQDMVVLQVFVDTREAMGANLVNTMCEGIAPLAAELTGGRVHLRILSNLTDRSVVHATVRFAPDALVTSDFTGEQVRDGIILANDLARVDPYRAATHNKGIMNGVDAVAIATGNDWRAIEAGAHAWAARDGRYRALTRWYRDVDGALAGEISIPIKVGTVGGSLETNPAVRINHHLLGSPSAAELAGILGVVGLAQNFAALRSLSTRGIQANHMKLHARSVVSTAGVPAQLHEKVVEALVSSGEIKVWKAREIAAAMGNQTINATRVSACGKSILLGEHAVVYGQPALAVPLPMAVEAVARKDAAEHRLIIDGWNHSVHLDESATGFAGALRDILSELDLADHPTTIELYPHLPVGMGLGSSAAMAVAAVRALNATYRLALDDNRINALAFRCEQAVHGTPSGVDNTVATYGRALRYQRDTNPAFRFISFRQPLPLVIGLSHEPGSTSHTVAAVRARHARHKQSCEHLFAEIGNLTDVAITAATAGDFGALGECMDICQGLLNALGVSTPALEQLVSIARGAGALGAKLTGGGGGGAIVALAPDQERVARAIEYAGYSAHRITIHSAE